jgi:predicted nucleotidyltransferase component of viral defense system
MNMAVQKMLSRYSLAAERDFENALKEIIQEIALHGLWRAKFFEKSAFYGGTALRILYGLDRFSEDLDFSLLTPTPDFDLSQYNSAVQLELKSLGFDVSVTSKLKVNEGAVQSAFIKANTTQFDYLIRFQKKGPLRTLKIKFEIDTDPPPYFETESKLIVHPSEFYVRTYTLSHLFSGKLHALLCRKWGNRVKGRDWYDFIWFVKNGISPNLQHLSARLWQTGHLKEGRILTPPDLHDLLNARIQALDISLAKDDVVPFVKDASRLDIWSAAFFRDILNAMKLT